MTPFAAMVAASAVEGLPGSFRTDLTVHDKRAVAALPSGARFYWVLYASGTHLVLLDGPTASSSASSRAELSRLLQAIGAVNLGEACFFFWDGGRLQRLGTAERAVTHCHEVLFALEVSDAD